MLKQDVAYSMYENLPFPLCLQHVFWWLDYKHCFVSDIKILLEILLLTIYCLIMCILVYVVTGFVYCMSMLLVF